MFHTLFFSYRNYRWLRMISAIGLLLCGIAFIVLFGGFPPLAWRFLGHVITTLPGLWTTQGLQVVLPLLGLVLQSLLQLMLWIFWVFVVVKAVQYELFGTRQAVVQKEEEQEVELPIQHTPLPAPASPFDAFPDTVYPRMPSSARRYSAPNAPAQRVATAASPIPARASAGLVAIHEPVQMSSTDHTKLPVNHAREAGRPLPSSFPECGSVPPLHVKAHQNVGETARVSLLPPKNVNPLSTRDTAQDDYTIEEFVEYAPFLDRFDEEDEDAAWDDEVLQEQSQLRLIVGIGSHPGITRKNGPNEDNVLGLQDTYVTDTGVIPVGLFVVADGMGGHSNGQEASRLAICSVSEVVTPTVLHADTEEAFSEDMLQEGVQHANEVIYQHNQQKFRMGTTITTALVFGSTAYVANVGDSRTYLYRPSEGLTQITSDHSHVWQLYKEGCIRHEDIYTHPRRNEIYRCLGEHEHVEIDTFQVALQAYDVLLLCTDGLWEMVHDTEIEHILQDNTLHASQISAKLIEAALHNGGADNVSAVVVCIDAKA